MINHVKIRDEIRDQVTDILEKMVEPDVHAVMAIIPIYPDSRRDLWLLQQSLEPPMIPILKQKLRKQGPVAIATIMENLVLEFSEDIRGLEEFQTAIQTGIIKPHDLPKDIIKKQATAIVMSYQTRTNTFTSHAEINDDATLGEWSPWEESGFGMLQDLLSFDNPTT